MEINTQIDLIRPHLREISPLLRDLDEIILNYVRLLYKGQYEWGNLNDIPNNVTCTFMLKMTVKSERHGFIFPYNIYHPRNSEQLQVNFSHKGNVDVIRMDDKFNFKFTVDETRHEYSDGLRYGNSIDTLVFNGPRLMITLLPYKFE